MHDCVFSANRTKRKRKLDVKKDKPLFWPIIIILGIVIFDQITKIWAVSALTGEPSYNFIGSLLRFSLVYNYGGAMGTQIGPSVYYLVMASIVLPVLLYYIYRSRHDRPMVIPMSFIAGGAIGNLIDRIRLGKVIDFIDVDFPDFTGLPRWWTFNIADSAITCAIVFLVIYILFVRRDEKEPAKTDNTIN